MNGVCCRLGVGSAVRVCFCIIQSLGLFVEKIADFLVLFVVFLMRIKKQERTPVFYLFNAGAGIA